MYHFRLRLAYLLWEVLICVFSVKFCVLTFTFQVCVVISIRLSWPIMLYCWLATARTKRLERSSGQSRTVGAQLGASKDSSALGAVLTSVPLKVLLLNQILFSSLVHRLSFYCVILPTLRPWNIYHECLFKISYHHGYQGRINHLVCPMHSTTPGPHWKARRRGGREGWGRVSPP